MEAEAPISRDCTADPDDEQPTILDALEPDQLVAAKRRFRRRHLRGVTRALMWGLRLYVLFALVVVVDRIVQTLVGQ